MLNPLTCPCPKCRTVVAFAPKTGPDTVQTCPQCGESFLPGTAWASADADRPVSSTLTLDPTGTELLPPNSSATLALPHHPDGSNSAGTLTLAAQPVGNGPSATVPERGSRSSGTGSEMPAKVGRFELQQLLGEGTFGRVYQAYDPVLRRPVALKVAKTEGMRSPEMVKRFQQEAQSAAHLQHPHIVPVFDSGQDGPYYYIAAGFIAGTTLAHSQLELPPGQTLPVRDTVQTVRKLAEALAYAHQQGVVHRDVKPANILVREDGEPLLADFGLASRAEGEQQPGQDDGAVGTPEYMAPEQWEAKALPASDQYSLGCVLFQLLTGELPFAAASSVHYRFLHLKQIPASPRKYRRGLSLDLEAICLKCLNKVPVSRYAGCQELANDLRRWLDGEPVEARRPGPVERTVKWARRRPFQAAFAVASLLVVGLFLFIGWREVEDSHRKLAQQLRSEEDRAGFEKEYLQGRELMAKGDWQGAQTSLAAVQRGLEVQHDLLAEDLQTRVKESLAVVDQHLRDDQARREAQDRLNRFRKPYADAVFSQLPLPGQGIIDHRDLTRGFASQALSLYGMDSERDDPGLLEQHLQLLNPEEFAWLTAACYELLLTWAEMEARSPPGQTESREQLRGRGEQALRMLDSAARLGEVHGIKTRVLFARRARYQALCQNKDAANPPLDPGAPPEPTVALDWFLTGVDLFQARKFEEAGQAVRRAIRLDGGNLLAHYLNGVCELKAGRLHEARSAVTVCGYLQSNFPGTLLLKGFVASEQGAVFLETERQARQRQAPGAADGEEVLRLRRLREEEFTSARAALDQVLSLKLDPQTRYAALAARGALLIHQERWSEAIADLEKAVQILPKAFNAHVSLSQALQGAGRTREGVLAVSRAIALAPNLPELYLARARLHPVRKDKAAARADLEQVVARELKTNPSLRLVESLVELGQLLARAGDDRAALAHFDEALRLRPDFVLTQRFRAEALLALDRRAEAAQALDQYLASTPTAPAEVYQARGLLYSQAGELPRAIDLYTLALNRNPRDVKTRGLRGWVYIQLNAAQAALEDFKACLSDQPDSAEYLIGRAAALVRLRLPGALADATAAQAKGALTDRLLYQLSCVYALAAVQIVAENRSNRDLEASNQVGKYESEALWLLRRTMEKLPPARREKFWREQVQTDPALTRLRGRREYLELAALFK